MAGVCVDSSYEWWKDANKTHNMNFGTDHGEINIRELNLEKDLPNPQEIEFVVGSPPCTQFSFANRGGNGDLADGLVDIYKFLEVVDYLSPKYWAMENVPRVAGIIKEEIRDDGCLAKFAHLFEGKNGIIKVYNSADYGVPQSRKRMIAGRFPHKLFDSYQTKTPRLELGDVIQSLNTKLIIDPIYGCQIDQLTDHILEPLLTNEEKRINSDAKTYHPVYNKMSFPDQLDRPSRTVTALCTRVSRESIVIKDEHDNLRRLTIRERGCVQSFPADYQYFANSYGSKLKLIGNAIPPILTFYIAQSMLETSFDDLKLPRDVENVLNKSNDKLPKFFDPENQGSKYPWSRSFWFAIPNLRFGSGIRFELRNSCNNENHKTYWKINFFYGNSKNIKQLSLDLSRFETIWESIGTIEIGNLHEDLSKFIEYIETIDKEGLQVNWTNIDRSRNSPIWLIDKIGDFASLIQNSISSIDSFQKVQLEELVELILKNGNGKIDNKKLIDSCETVITGIIIGSVFNSVMIGESIDLELVV